jgi:hypothetical protein
MHAIDSFYLCSVPYAIPIEVVELEEAREVERVTWKASILDYIYYVMIILTCDAPDASVRARRVSQLHMKAASALTCCSA